MHHRIVRRRHLSPSRIQPSPVLLQPDLAGVLYVERETSAGGYTVLRLVGELESATVPMFRQAICETAPLQRLIIDMSRVPFLDSCGVGALIGAARRVRDLDGTTAIAAVCPSVQRVLKLTGIDRIVHLAGSVEEAAAFLEGTEADSPTDGEAIAI